MKLEMKGSSTGLHHFSIPLFFRHTSGREKFILCAVGRNGPNDEHERSMTMNKKYVCKICGWVYDPAEHDNVAFEDLPSDWHCPVCGVGKDDFEPAYN